MLVYSEITITSLTVITVLSPISFQRSPQLFKFNVKSIQYYNNVYLKVEKKIQ